MAHGRLPCPPIQDPNMTSSRPSGLPGRGGVFNNDHAFLFRVFSMTCRVRLESFFTAPPFFSAKSYDVVVSV